MAVRAHGLKGLDPARGTAAYQSDVGLRPFALTSSASERASSFHSLRKPPPEIQSPARRMFTMSCPENRRTGYGPLNSRDVLLPRGPNSPPYAEGFRTLSMLLTALGIFLTL